MTNRIPGQRDGRTTSPRDCLLSHKYVRRVVGGGVIDATYAYDGKNTNKTQELRAGCLMAKITATGLWVPLKATRVSEGTSGSGSGTSTTTLNVDNSAFFKAGDTISIAVAAGSVNRTINSINYSTDVLTLDSAIDNPNIGGLVQARGDLAGAETARAILNEFIDMIDHDDNTARDRTAAELVIAALVNEDKVLGDLAVVRENASSHYLAGILWGDEQGM